MQVGSDLGSAKNENPVQIDFIILDKSSESLKLFIVNKLKTQSNLVKDSQATIIPMAGAQT